MPTTWPSPSAMPSPCPPATRWCCRAGTSAASSICCRRSATPCSICWPWPGCSAASRGWCPSVPWTRRCNRCWPISAPPGPPSRATTPSGIWHRRPRRAVGPAWPARAAGPACRRHAQPRRAARAPSAGRLPAGGGRGAAPRAGPAGSRGGARAGDDLSRHAARRHRRGRWPEPGPPGAQPGRRGGSAGLWPRRPPPARPRRSRAGAARLRIPLLRLRLRPAHRPAQRGPGSRAHPVAPRRRARHRAKCLALCALHHKLFDLGAFTVEPAEHRVVFSQHAISGDRGLQGALRHHGQQLLAPQQADMRPAPDFLAWNLKNVFKAPARRVGCTAQPR